MSHLYSPFTANTPPQISRDLTDLVCTERLRVTDTPERAPPRHTHKRTPVRRPTHSCLGLGGLRPQSDWRGPPADSGRALTSRRPPRAPPRRVSGVVGRTPMSQARPRLVPRPAFKDTPFVPSSRHIVSLACLSSAQRALDHLICSGNHGVHRYLSLSLCLSLSLSLSLSS